MWKEMAGCDQLYSHPTTRGLDTGLNKLVTRNYSVDIPGEPSTDAIFELDNINQTKDSIASTVASSEISRERDFEAGQWQDDLPQAQKVRANVSDGLGGDDDTLGDASTTAAPTVPHQDYQEAPKQAFDGIQDGTMDEAPLNDFSDLAGVDIGAMPETSGMGDIDDAQVQLMEQQSDELTEEFEQRRWTKRTQQVLHVLQRNLTDTDQVLFSALTHNCSRKQAASRFYTCLLLAKEGMVSIYQPEPYADIQLTKGPKYEV